MLLSLAIGLAILALDQVDASNSPASIPAQEVRKTGVEEQSGPAGNARRPAQREFAASESISELVLLPAVCTELDIPAERKQSIVKAQNQACSLVNLQALMRSRSQAISGFIEALRSNNVLAIADAQSRLVVATSMLDQALSARDKATILFLSPAQYKRLLQILLRQAGVRALTRPDVATRVGLTELQVQRINAILTERFVHLAAQQNAPAPDFKSQQHATRMNEIVRKSRAGEKMLEEDRLVLSEFNKRVQRKSEELDRLENHVDSQIAKVLTRPQRRRFSELLGEPFDLHSLTRDSIRSQAESK